jgi:hypothetical protein
VPRSELTCREFVDLIRGLRDEELNDAERRPFLQHRRRCARCSNYLKGYELTVAATKRIANDSRDLLETTIPKLLAQKILGHRLKRPTAL